jgi:hypothetical protein
LKKLLLIALAMTVAISMFGCGDDSNSPKTKTPGDNNDQNFRAIQSQISEELLPGMLESLNSGISLLDFDGGPIMKTNDTSYYDFNNDSYWWRYVDQAEEEGEGYYYNYAEIDSFRFEEGSQFQQYPDSGTTTGMDTRQHFDNVSYQTGDSNETHVDVLYHYTGLAGDIMTIAGTSDINYSFAMDSLSLAYEFGGNFSNVTIPIANVDPDSNSNHPTGGGMGMTIHYESQSLNPNYPDGTFDWSLNLTFSETGYHARVESGDNYWEWDGTWDETLAAHSKYWPKHNEPRN